MAKVCPVDEMACVDTSEPSLIQYKVSKVTSDCGVLEMYRIYTEFGAACDASKGQTYESGCKTALTTTRLVRSDAPDHPQVAACE